MDEVASSACEDEKRRKARAVARRKSKALTGLIPKHDGLCQFVDAIAEMKMEEMGFEPLQFRNVTDEGYKSDFGVVADD